MRFVTTLLTTFIFCQLHLVAVGQTQDVTTRCAEQTGKAAYYSDKLHGNNTASGEPYDKNALMAAHRTLEFNSLVEVTNLKNNRTVTVRITDRGPHDKSKGKILDLSRAAAAQIGMISEGIGTVRLKVLRVGEDGPRCGESTDTSTGGNAFNFPEEENDDPFGSVFGDDSGTDEPFTSFDDDTSPSDEDTGISLSERTYSITDKALVYNIWGEQVQVEGYGVLISESTSLEAAIDAGLEAYYKDFHQVFILADAPSEEARIFRVIVGQGKRRIAQKTGAKLVERGIRSVSLVKHKGGNPSEG